MNPSWLTRFSAPSEAKLWAQMIAMAPFMFQAALCLRNFGILKRLSTSGTNGATIEELRTDLDLSEYGVSVLLDAGESSGLLSSSNGRYFITQAGSFLENDRMTRVNMDFTHDVCYQGLFSLEDSIKQGQPLGLKVFGSWKTIYEGLIRLPRRALKSWLDFDHYFSDDAFPRVLPLILKNRPRSLVDIGGNTGKFAVACAKFDPELHVHIVDHPSQLELAFTRAQDFGVLDRITGESIDMLNHNLPLPSGQDVYWMSQFLDCFSKADILEILKRTAAAMSEDSRLFIMEPFIDRQRYEAAKFCLNMTSLYFTCMANGRSRMYPARDFYEILNQAGLDLVQEHGPIRLSQTLLECKKRIK